MTAIVGFVDKKAGITYLAADSMGSNGSTGQMYKTEKLFTKGDISMAYCGSYRVGQVLKTGLEPRKMFVGEKIDDYISNYLVDYILGVLEQKGVVKNNSGVKIIEGAAFIIAIKDRLFIYNGDCSLLEAEKPYLADGSGEYHVQSVVEALVENSDLTPKEILKKAIEIASRFVLSVGGEVHIIEHKHNNAVDIKDMSNPKSIVQKPKIKPIKKVKRSIKTK